MPFSICQVVDEFPHSYELHILMYYVPNEELCGRKLFHIYKYSLEQSSSQCAHAHARYIYIYSFKSIIMLYSILLMSLPLSFLLQLLHIFSFLFCQNRTFNAWSYLYQDMLVYFQILSSIPQQHFNFKHTVVFI